MVCSPPGSSVHGILQARRLEWVGVLSSRWSSRPRDQSKQILYPASHKESGFAKACPTVPENCLRTTRGHPLSSLLWLFSQRRVFVGVPCLWLLGAFSQWEAQVEALSLGEVRAYFCRSLPLEASPDPPSASFAIVLAPQAVSTMASGPGSWSLKTPPFPIAFNFKACDCFEGFRFWILSPSLLWLLDSWVKFLLFRNPQMGLPWWSSGWDSLLPIQRALIQSLVRKLRSHMPWHSLRATCHGTHKQNA